MHKKSKRNATLGYHLLSLPSVALSAVVVLIPACVTFYAAFTKWNGMSTNMQWIGIQNFIELMQDWIFWKALSNNFKWTLIFVTVPVAVAMLAAALLVRMRKGKSFFQTVYLIPYLLAPTTNAIIWLNIIFSPNAGLIGFLQKTGLQVSSPLGTMQTALGGVAMVDIWHYWGFLTVVYLAALRQTPQDQLESANIEGANGWQVFRYIYLPNIAPTVRLMFVLIVIYSFLTFDYVYLLTWGGPAHATEMLSTFAYTLAFATFNFGKAAAVSLVMGLFGGVAAFFYSWFSRKETLQ
ncbi:MAG: sugar ABC transporter permease [Bacillota bacterium]